MMTRAEYIEREACLSILRAKANMAVLMDAAPYFEKAAQMLEKLPAADVAPVVHARWITRSDKGIISMTHPYMCSRCWRVEMNKEPYCNCGAKMDGDNENVYTVL